MKYILSILSISLILGLTACSQSPSKENANLANTPSWVTTPPSIVGKQFSIVQSAPIIGGDVKQAIKDAEILASKKLHANAQSVPEGSQSRKMKYKGLNRGILEEKIRNRVRLTIVSPKVPLAKVKTDKTYVDVKNKLVFIKASVRGQSWGNAQQKRLTQLDNQLTEYLHVSQQGNHLSQLLSVLPVLPTLIERSELINQKRITGQKTTMPNDALAFQFNQKITILFNRFVTGIQASSPETKHNASELAQALDNKGFQVSAFLPDLLIKYYIESETNKTDKGVSVQFTNDMELDNDNSSQFATISSETQGLGKNEADARQKAFSALAQNIQDVFIKKTVQYIQAVNKFNHNR